MSRQYTKEQIRDGCIDIESGGYYCSACKQWHPTQSIDAASGVYVCSNVCRAQFGWQPDPFPIDD